MPPSQLKRLKASLRDQGVTGPQKSKKQKKELASSKTSTDRVQRQAALQNIRDSFNPFELKAPSRPEKFEHASFKNAQKSGSRYKDVLHRPGVTRSAGEEMRRNTLLPEMRRRNKVGGLVDRRIGEGDADMTPEEKAVQRFAREKERKAKGRSMFDLEGSDNEDSGGFGLTHGGKKIDDLVADDFGEDVLGGSDEEEDDDGELLRRKRGRDDEDEDGMHVEEQDDDQPGRKKTKKEVMEEVIAKSKLHKYERQKVKEDDDDLREKLDQDISELMGLLQGVKKRPAPSDGAETAATTGDGPVMNSERQKLLNGGDKEYDKYMKQLTNEARAAPSNKSLTAEEKAQKEAERLEILEEKRQKRMRGEDVSDYEKEAPAPDGDFDIRDDDEELADEAADFGFTNAAPQPKVKDQQLVLDDEDEFALDEDLVASGSEPELSDDESGESSDNNSEADGEPQEDEEDEFVTEILGAKGATGSNATKVGDRTATTTSGVAFTYPCPRSHNELLGIVKNLPAEQLPTVIQGIRALYHPSLSASNKESMSDFACALVDHLAYMGDERQSMKVIEQVIRHLHSLSRTYPTAIGEQFRLNLASLQGRTQPSAGDMVILTAIGSIYPTSDHWHQIVTPAVTLMARWLGLHAPISSKPIEEQTLATGAFIVALCIKYQQLSKRYMPETLRFTIRVLSSERATKATLRPYFTSLTAMADLWKEKSTFAELFAPTLPHLKSLSAKKELQHIKILLQQARLRRRPLELHHHRKQPLRTSIPKFEENFNPDRHYDPDKERSDANKLQKEYKREKKGALRELRKDANFIAREQLKEKRSKDEEYEKKHRRLIAEIQSEEGRGGNEYAREKARRQRKK